MAVVTSEQTIGPGAKALPWPFRHHGLTVGILVALITIIWRVLLVSHFSLVVGAAEVAAVILLFMWLAWRVVQRSLGDNWHINSFEVYVLLMVFLPVGSAIGAVREFGQPFLWGLIAFKDYYLLLGVLVVHQWLRVGWITLAQLGQALLIVAWTCLVYFYFATLFINPAPYQDSPLAGANDIKGGGVYYRFNMCAIYFGAIYYAAAAFMRRKWHYLVYALLFAAYVMLFRMDRTSMAVTAIGMAGVVAWHAPWKRIAKVLLLALLPAALAVVLVFLAAPAKIGQYRLMFTDAWHTVTGASEGMPEISVRSLEVAIAKRQVAQHPWIGNGRISHTWNDAGYDPYLGFFYPADVGMLGLVFIYGYPGMVFLYLVFLLAFIYMLRAGRREGDVLYATCQFLLLALFLDSLTNGQLTQSPAQALLLACIMHYYSRMAPEQPALRIPGTATA